jgi:hypothetical protein
MCPNLKCLDNFGIQSAENGDISDVEYDKTSGRVTQSVLVETLKRIESLTLKI